MLLTVDRDAAGQRLDRWLAVRIPDLSRSRLQELIDGGHVTVDGAARSLIASGVSVLLAWSTWTVLDDWLGRSTIAQIVTVGAAIAAAAAAYLAAAQAFEMPELAALSRLRRPLP